MTIPNHLALGLIIGKLTGNYGIAVSASVLIDCDHFIALARHGKLKDWKMFWEAITDPEDSFSDQRGALHTLFSALVVALASYFLFSPIITLTLALSHVGHLLLDTISDSDSWPLRPFSNVRVRGFIPYYSKYEILFFFALLLIFFLL